MRLFTTITNTVFAMAVGALVGALIALGVTHVFAQATPVPQPQVTCEQQLEQAQTAMIQLRKEKAQAEWSAASVEEYARTCKKQLDAAAPAKPDKAAAQAPSSGPAPSPTPKK